MELYNELELQIIKSTQGSLASEQAIDGKIQIQNIDYDQINLHKDTLDEFVSKFKELCNLNILRYEYGIDIPEHDLIITVDSTNSEIVPANSFNA